MHGASVLLWLLIDDHSMSDRRWFFISLQHQTNWWIDVIFKATSILRRLWLLNWDFNSCSFLWIDVEGEKKLMFDKTEYVFTRWLIAPTSTTHSRSRSLEILEARKADNELLHDTFWACVNSAFDYQQFSIKWLRVPLIIHSRPRDRSVQRKGNQRSFNSEEFQGVVAGEFCSRCAWRDWLSENTITHLKKELLIHIPISVRHETEVFLQLIFHRFLIFLRRRAPLRLQNKCSYSQANEWINEWKFKLNRTVSISLGFVDLLLM